MFLGDGPLGYTLNGKSFPATSPLWDRRRGDGVLMHLANDGSMLHPMHLHGYHFEVVAQDGSPLGPGPYLADTLVVAPGQRFDVLVHATEPGAWAFHCHILPHVEGPEGMFGMVTALVVSWAHAQGDVGAHGRALPSVLAIDDAAEPRTRSRGSQVPCPRGGRYRTRTVVVDLEHRAGRCGKADSDVVASA